MTEQCVDLHLHSDHSDGSDPPALVAERAAKLHLAAIALTDHDTVSGVEEAAREAAARGIGFLPAVEISAVFDSHELHILGLGVDFTNPALVERLSRMLEARAERADAIIERLNGVGVPVTGEAVRARARNGAVTRIHIAKEVHALGHSKTVQDAFDKYMLKGKPAFVSKVLMPAAEAIDHIHEAGGLAFIAHPGLGSTRKRLPKLLRFPFDGIEVLHTAHTPGQVEEFKELARAHGLLMSGGSDCHGTIKGYGPEMGKVNVPGYYYDRIQEALAAKT